MRKVLLKQHLLRSLFSFLFWNINKASTIRAQDLGSEIDLVGLPSGIQVFELKAKLASYAIYLNGERIVEVRDDLLRASNTSSFSKEYFSFHRSMLIFYDKKYE